MLRPNGRFSDTPTQRSGDVSFRDAWAGSRAPKGNLVWPLLIGLLVVGGIIVLLLLRGSPVERTTQSQPLMMYAAAGLRGPAEQIAAQYKQAYGVEVSLQFGGSNSLLNQLQVNKFDTADLFLAADDFYTEKAVELGLAAEVLPIATQRPVIAVRKDAALEIDSLDDLLADSVRVSMADPEQAAIGKAVKSALEGTAADGASPWSQLAAHVTAKGVYKPTVNDVATDVVLGAVDAGIMWDATVAGPEYRDKLRAIHIPEFDAQEEMVSLAVLQSSPQPTAALKFARFLAASDRGLPVFADAGLQAIEGDAWAETPELTFFCGAVNRRAVERVVDEFQKREGVVINTVYDGCGTLTGRMQTIDGQQTALGFPDIYMACDRYYLDNVKDWFQEDYDVSDMEIVLAVPHGSTTVSSLSDLTKPGVRVAIGQPDQCTLGALTRRLLQQQGLYDALVEKQSQAAEVVVEKPSSALIVPDVVTGHVDVGVAYLTDVLAEQDRVDVIHIDAPQNVAIQPFSIARSSGRKHLARRFFVHLSRSREAFEALGFHFRLANDSASSK
jgi:molybdenum ABC transporter molybdate-binding protein